MVEHRGGWCLIQAQGLSAGCVTSPARGPALTAPTEVVEPRQVRCLSLEESASDDPRNFTFKKCQKPPLCARGPDRDDLVAYVPACAMTCTWCFSAIAAIDAALRRGRRGGPDVHVAWRTRRPRWPPRRRLRARAEALELRLLAAADDVAEATGARSTADLAGRPDPRGPRHRTPPRRRWRPRSDQRWTQTAEAFAAGERRTSPRRGVIAEALDALPEVLGEDLLAKAETLLVTEAATLGPREAESSVPGAGVTWPPRSPRKPSTSGCWPPNAAPPPPPGCTYGPAATGPPTCTPGSPTTPPAGCAPTSTPSPHPAAATSTTGRPWTPRSVPSPRRSVGRVGQPPDRPATRPGVRRTPGEHPHQLAPPPRRHRHHGDRHPRPRHPGPRHRGGHHLHRRTPHRRQPRRLACQAGIIPAVLGGRSEVLDVGRRETPGPPTPSRKASNLRDHELHRPSAGPCRPPTDAHAHHPLVPRRRGQPEGLPSLPCTFHRPPRATTPPGSTTSTTPTKQDQLAETPTDLPKAHGAPGPRQPAGAGSRTTKSACH